MKSLSSHPTSTPVFFTGFFRAASVALIGAALLGGPTLINAQNSHKPTSKHFKIAVDDTAPPQAEAAVQPSNEGLTTLLGISLFSPTAPTTVTTPTWTALGPAPIPNGQTIPADVNGISLTQQPVSGRVTAISIDPSNSNTVYVGAAQGGVNQSTNGGVTWRRLMDAATTTADTLAV